MINRRDFMKLTAIGGGAWKGGLCAKFRSGAEGWDVAANVLDS